MTKLFAIVPALALVVALSGSALAENGTVGTTTLQDMGLAGLEIMSDESAMEIRGKGYQGGNHQPHVKKPWSAAYGSSFAGIAYEGAEAGTLDGFAAEGKYMAAGEHFSEAGKTVTESHLLEVKGLPAILEVNTTSVRVFAGGFSSASSL